MTSLLLLLLLIDRIYHPETIASLPRSHRTHVQVEGTVTLVRTEADGDVHIRLTDGTGHVVICEIIPLIPLPHPAKGQRVRVRGIRRYDNERGHGFFEVHPVEEIEVLR